MNSRTQIENALMDSLEQLVNIQQNQDKSIAQLAQSLVDSAKEHRSAQVRMDNLQQQINSLIESVKQQQSWQSELFSRLDGLENGLRSLRK